MKIICGLAVLLMTACLGQAIVLTDTDNFNDGVRNQAFWTVERTNAFLLETGGHLYGYTSAAYSEKPSREAFWRMKSIRWVVPSQIMEVEAQFRFPVDGGIPANKDVQMMIGWTSLGLYSNRTAGAVLFNDPLGRSVGIYLRETPSSSHLYALAVMPECGSRLWLKLRYNSVTGNLSLRFKAAAADPWTKIRDINMNTYWKVPVGTSLFLRPFIKFQSYNSYYNTPGRFFFDDFTARLISP